MNIRQQQLIAEFSRNRGDALPHQLWNDLIAHIGRMYPIPDSPVEWVTGAGSSIRVDPTFTPFPVVITGKTVRSKATDKITYGDSDDYAVFDWREQIMDGWSNDDDPDVVSGTDPYWANRPPTHTGTYAQGDGCIEAHFTNLNLQVSTDNIVWLHRLYRAQPSQNGYWYVFDAGVTNESDTLRAEV